MSRLWVDRLVLGCFRSYSDLTLSLSAAPVVLTGNNGAGKTNILEALSFLSPGRGLRQAKLSQVTALGQSPRPWSVHAVLKNEAGEEDEVGTGLVSSMEERRIVKINHTQAPQADLNTILSVFWMTPQIDQLLSEGMSNRRRFLDKLVVGLYPDHTQHLYRYEYAMRERSRLLRDGLGDDRWLRGLEEKMAAESLAIHSLRSLYLSQINPLAASAHTLFPTVSVFLEGEVENGLREKAALDVEDGLIDALKKNRHDDARVGGSQIGAHQTTVQFFHVNQKKKAEFCSTGEQKALLLSFILANARLHINEKRRTPILLLDEVVAHLDAMRRSALLEEILQLGVQAWMTGTDAEVFHPLREKAQFLNIENGKIKQES